LGMHADSIPVRPHRDLLKALGFTVAGGTIFFTASAIVEWKKNDRRVQRIVADVRNFTMNQRDRLVRGMSDFDSSITAGQKCVLSIVAINALVTLVWMIRSLEPMMWRFFTNSYASKSLCSPMLLSVFSHSSYLHLLVNMYVLYNFAPQMADKVIGVEQFLAFYATAGLVSSLASLMHKSVTRSPIRALGASGAILALITYTCMKMPEQRLSIIFLPMFNFSAESAVYGILIFDLVGLTLASRFKLFDHAAHLGGSLFGILYAMYGERFYRTKFRPFIQSQYRKLRASSVGKG